MDGYSLVSSGCSLREKRCSTYRSLLPTVLLSAAVGVSALMVGQSSRAQALFIGEARRPSPDADAANAHIGRWLTVVAAGRVHATTRDRWRGRCSGKWRCCRCTHKIPRE